MTLRQQLDYERSHVISFTVIATDSLTPSSALSSTATVSVSLIDINDNTPVFQPHPTQYSVEENSPNGTLVATITATDADSGSFGEIFYSMQVTNDDNSLTIDSKTVSTCIYLSPLFRILAFNFTVLYPEKYSLPFYLSPLFIDEYKTGQFLLFILLEQNTAVFVQI